MLPRRVLAGAVSSVIFAASIIPATAQVVGELYLRGDAAWSGAVNANIHDRNFPVDHLISGANGTPGTLSDLGSSGWLVGVGGGQRFSPTFRGDIVYTYRGDYRLDQMDQAVPAHIFRATTSSNSVMANVYADFRIGVPNIIPYVGFGIGWSNLNFSNLSWTGGSLQPTATALAPGGTTDNLAWQVTAGFAFSLAEEVIIDVFYRYFDGGHVKTEAGNVTVTGVGTSIARTYSGAEGALHAHEVGVSLRFPVGY